MWPNHAFERDGVAFGATSLAGFASLGAAQRERWAARSQ
jgi:hypothetical protein